MFFKKRNQTSVSDVHNAEPDKQVTRGFKQIMCVHILLAKLKLRSTEP